MADLEISLVEAIKHSEMWAESCKKLIANHQGIIPSDRNRVAAALFHIGLEHQSSILHLTRLMHYGSAYALIRPQFEAFIRGIWMHRCATQKEISSFIANKEPPKIDQLLTKIEALQIFEKDSLFNLKNKVWKVLCGFTHGGYVQVSWRLSGNEIVSDFGEKQVIALLAISQALTFTGLIALSALAKDETMARNVMASYKEIFGAPDLPDFLNIRN